MRVKSLFFFDETDSISICLLEGEFVLKSKLKKEKCEENLFFEREEKLR